MFSDVWSENAALFERLMEIHSNPPILYYGFKITMPNGGLLDLSNLIRLIFDLSSEFPVLITIAGHKMLVSVT